MTEDNDFQCSPAVLKTRRGRRTCLPPSSIERLRKAWNETHPRNKIGVRNAKKTRKNTNQKPTEGAGDSWGRLQSVMKNHYKCDTEYCAVKKLANGEEKREMMGFFRPEKPKEWSKKPTQWLDSLNIADVMKQYEAAEDAFEFIGPVPIDFDEKQTAWGKCVVDELCKLNVSDMKVNGKTKIGIVFNLDPSDEPGSHWICAYIDVNGKKAYYFDSYGFEPPEEIANFLKRMKSQGVTDVYYNDIRHQRKGSECGMYCLYVLICLLNGKPFYDICNNIINDDLMNAFRDILFATDKIRREAIEEALPRLCMAPAN